MLVELAVRDLGVIDDLTLTLGPGVTALTGETGAGKTMIVGAIGLLTGERADASIVRQGAAEAVVQGRFVVADDELVLTRVVPRDGRSRAYRDGLMVTAAELAAVSATLVDLHGQHAHVGLLTTASQRRALDRFAGVDLEGLQAARRHLAECEHVLAELGGDAGARAAEIDLLRHEVGEIERAGISGPEEDLRLAAEDALLSDADAHRLAAAAAEAALDNEGGARALVASALSELAGRSPFDREADRLQSVAADLDDIARELRSIGEQIEADPQRLAAVQERRALLADLGRRYAGGNGVDAVLAAGTRLGERLAHLESVEERAEVAESQRADARDRVARAAAEVGARRRQAAPALAAAVRERLAELSLPTAEVAVEVGGEDPGDDVTFLLALNSGLPAAPLAKAASGGELARTMLALRLVVGARVGCLVFDEVDAGVGGAAARSVGRALAALGEHGQVLVVTHLPQVAAFADAQIALTKRDDGRTTTVAAESLGPDARVRELARMLSGLADSDTGQDHAEELLSTAAAERRR